MNLNKVIERINLYQNEPVFHELTCGNNSLHNVLQAKIDKGIIKLYCSDCNYVQTYIPDFFFSDEFEKLYLTQKRILDSL